MSHEQGGPSILFRGAGATFVANLVGHYPWFAVYNVCDEQLPPAQTFRQLVFRNALIGLAASASADIASNAIRVVKVNVQVRVGGARHRQEVRESD